MRKYRHLNAVRWGYPPTIDGDYLHFAGTTGQPDSIHEIVLGKDPYCSQFALYKDTGQEWVTSIADPLPAGWSHAESSKVVTINHHISPDWRVRHSWAGKTRVTATKASTTLKFP